MNLLFVFSDQPRYSALDANGNQVVRTPNLDRMAAEGMVCDNMFSNHPLCSPFRAILLTGRYAWQNGVIEYGKRGPRGFVDVGQRWANPERYKDISTA